MFAQFDEARQIYRRFAQEAAQTKPTSPAVEIVHASGEGRADRLSGMELLGFVAIMGVALAVRTRARPPADRTA